MSGTGGCMDVNDVASYLYAEFEQEEFLTRQISDATMIRLARMMGIADDGQSRKIKVGQYISNLEGTELIPSSGQKVKLVVTRPKNNSHPRRFQFVPVSLADNASVSRKVSAGQTAQGLAFDVVLTYSGYGYSVSCPALLGCHTQGMTEAEALENVREAITGWLQAEARSVKRRAQDMMDEYNAAGYPSKIAVVDVPPVAE